MNFAGKLLLKLSPPDKRKSGKTKADKDNDDPANVIYETYEHGYKYPREELGCGINLMKYRNEL